VDVVYKKRMIIGTVFVGVLFFVVRHCTYLHQGFKSFSSCCLYPLLRVQQLCVEPISRWMNRSVSIAELETTIENLQKKYDDLCAENVALKGMHQYADETRELRTFNKRYTQKSGCVAQVLARHFSLNNQFFLLNAGGAHGIKKDMVALHCNAIVGKVVEVYPWYCKVSLITDVDCKVAALCRSYGAKGLPYSAKASKGLQKNVSGIHEGANDISRTNMRYVSHLDIVHVGDDVLSSGEGLVFPKGFSLGKVISADKGELFYTIVVQPSLDLQTLCYCTLIAKEDI
jgi:rod shape-determining protein MreC